MRRRCPVCNEWFECYNKERRGGLPKANKRAFNSITCSKRCSIIYGSVCNRISKSFHI